METSTGGEEPDGAGHDHGPERHQPDSVVSIPDVTEVDTPTCTYSREACPLPPTGD